MTRRTETLNAGYFDSLYSADPDPWAFRTSDYERDKYQATLAALSRTHYASALEIGCSIGVFTAALSARCGHLLAIDGSDVALAIARQSCSDRANVRFETRMVPGAFPPGQFDLIVLSEVLYYLQPGDLERVAALCGDALTQTGEIVLCHWLGATDYPLSGQQASDAFVSAMVRQAMSHDILNDRVYRLDRLKRLSGPT